MEIVGYEVAEAGSPLGFSQWVVHLRKFKMYWEECHDSIIDMDDDNIIKCIQQCGIIYKEKVYMPEKMLDEDT